MYELVVIAVLANEESIVLYLIFPVLLLRLSSQLGCECTGKQQLICLYRTVNCFWPASFSFQAKLGFERLSIPKIYHPFIAIVADELKAKHGCRINIPPASVPSDDLTVAGERDGVLHCAEEIRQLYENKKQTTTTISIQVR